MTSTHQFLRRSGIQQLPQGSSFNGLRTMDLSGCKLLKRFSNKGHALLPMLTKLDLSRCACSSRYSISGLSRHQCHCAVQLRN